MLILSEGKTTFNSKNGGKKIPTKKLPYYLFMIVHALSIYKEILECYEYETRNPTVYGNVIHSKVEHSKSSEKLQSNRQGNEDNV